jgi:enoyl-[acyl-carrier protein] reductase I
VKTLASSGVNNFRYIMKWNELNSPLQRNTNLNDVGKSGVYLISDLSSGVTGEIHHVDCGYNIVGMLAPNSTQEISDLLNNANLDQ